MFELSYSYPRYASTPMETFGVIAHFERAPDRFTVWSNFQGPFVLQPLMAGALRVPGHRLRLITPPSSGGSFGIKQAILSYIVLLAAVSRKTGVPVKWIEDRAEHLTAASASSDRIGTISAAFTGDGELTGLRFRNVANMGAYIRAPEPASLYRMHAASNGCYRVENIAVENELVVSNSTPVGLNRGYGGPQFYFALERIMDIAARGLNIDAAELRRRNFIASDAFPYRTPAGAVLDAGDYDAALTELLRVAGYEGLQRRREDARRAGKLYGIGIAAGIEPSGSNMAYISLAQSAQDRSRTDRKSGGSASAVVSVDPSGQVTLRLCSTPNGQGHATVAAQIVADALGLAPDDIDVVTDIDTSTSAWSIASGNYSNRFASIVVDAIARSAEQVATKVRLLAAQALDASPQDIELADGYARVRGKSNKGMPFRKVAARAHWDPAGLPTGATPGIHEIAVVSPAVLGSPDEADRIASATTFGFVIDLAAIEVDPRTGSIRIDKYASVHDVGTMLNPRIVEGQIHGGFVHGLGAALLEELVYDERGNFQSGTFADYLCPTAVEVPPLTIGHIVTASPMNALGAKGMGDGSAMLTPAAMANAVADALGRDDVVLPLTLQRVWLLANGHDPQIKRAAAVAKADQPIGPGALTGQGEVVLAAPVEEVWRRLVDPQELAAIVPGCQSLTQDGPDSYSRAGDHRGCRHPWQLRRAHRDARQAGRQVGSSRGRGVGSVRLRIGIRAGHARTRRERPHAARVSIRGRRRRQGRGGGPADAGHRNEAADRSVLPIVGKTHRPAAGSCMEALVLSPALPGGAPAVKPAPFDYYRPGSIAEAVGLLAGIAGRGRGARRRNDARPDAQSSHRAPARGHRYLAYPRARQRSRRRRKSWRPVPESCSVTRWMRMSSGAACRCWRWRCHGSDISRPAIGGRWEGRWHTRIPAPKFRSRWW